jgi:prefoldin subunit 5
MSQTLQITRYEDFIDQLRIDLNSQLTKRDLVYDEISNCCKLQSQLKLIIGKTKTKVNIGCDFFMDAVITDLSKIIMNVGLDYYVEMDRYEAEIFLRKKKEVNEVKTKAFTVKIASIRSHIKLVLRTIQEVTLSITIADGIEH